MNLTTILSEIIEKQKDRLWLFVPILLGFGAAFYISFEERFSENYLFFLTLFFASVLFSYLTRFSFRSLAFLSVAIFLFGCFYTNFYQNIFLNQTKITGKVYVDAVAKVESIKEFYNPRTKLTGASLLLTNLNLYQTDFTKKPEVKKIKITKKRKSEKKPSHLKKNCHEVMALLFDLQDSRDSLCQKPKKIKSQKVKKYSAKKVHNSFVNIDGYQDVDRKFMDFSKHYQQVKWVENNGRKQFVNPPQKIFISLPKYYHDLNVNDLIAIRVSLEMPDKRQFPDDFDFGINAKAQKIGAYGYGMGKVKILRKAQISSLDQYFISLSSSAKERILKVLSNDEAAIAIALLVGDQNYISKNLMIDIRNSGLAHLLSISGFHLSLMATIFLFITRFLLSRSENLALNFDLKKIAAIAAIFATYFYLKIANSPLPAQRSFLMVLFFLISIFLSQKINAKRVVMSALFLMILANPYNIFNIGFQLSFLAIIVLGAFYDNFSKFVTTDSKNFIIKFFYYFLGIILTSIAIQIAMIPLLMHSFQNISILGFIANILAIPLASFFVMPLGFLALFLMPIFLEKYVLLLMKPGLTMIAKIAHFVANLDYSYFISPKLSNAGLIIALIGIFLICLSKDKLRIFGILLFIFSFFTISFNHKPNLAFSRDQKLFAIYDEKDGLIISKEIANAKLRDAWLKFFTVKEYKTFDDFSDEELKTKGILCDEKKCLIKKNKNFLILIKRNELSEICQNNFDVIVNLTRKYELPACVEDDKIKINNLDFYQKGGWFFYFLDDGLKIRNSG